MELLSLSMKRVANIQGAAMETVSMAVRDGFGTRQNTFGTVL